MIQEPQHLIHKSALLVILCCGLNNKESHRLSGCLLSPIFLSYKPWSRSRFPPSLLFSCAHLQSLSKPISCISRASHFCHLCRLLSGPDHGSGRGPGHLSLLGLLIDNCHLTGLLPLVATIPVHRSCRFLIQNSPHWLLDKIKSPFQDASTSNPCPPFYLPPFTLPSSSQQPCVWLTTCSSLSSSCCLLQCLSCFLECPHPSEATLSETPPCLAKANTTIPLLCPAGDTSSTETTTLHCDGVWAHLFPHKTESV